MTPEPKNTPQLHITASTVGATLASAVGVLLGAHVALQLAFGIGHGERLTLTRMFDLDWESNLPTWYSASALLMCALTLGFIAAIKRQAADQFSRRWTILCLGFVYLSADESAVIHELIGPMFVGSANWLTAHVSKDFSFLAAVPTYGWLLPGVVAVAAVGVYFIKFLLALPRATAVLFVVSGGLFVGGTIGFEVVGGFRTVAVPGHGPIYMGLATIEEALEMGGIALFLFALLHYAASQIGSVNVAFRASASKSPVRLEQRRSRVG